MQFIDKKTEGGALKGKIAFYCDMLDVTISQIRECQNRPAGMSVVDWCASHGITKAKHYYRLRRVRQACLENLPPEAPAQQIVPVNTCLLQQETMQS